MSKAEAALHLTEAQVGVLQTHCNWLALCPRARLCVDMVDAICAAAIG